MIILLSAQNVSVCVRDTDLFEGNKRFYAFSGNGYYDPVNDFKPCFSKKGEKPRRRLYDGYVEEYKQSLPEAEAMFDKVKMVYESKSKAMVGSEAPDTASKTVEKWLSESAEYHSTTHTSEDVQRLTEDLREAKDFLTKALEVIKARSSCSLPCIYCAYDGSEDCPREAVFKWKYEDRVKEVLKSNE